MADNKLVQVNVRVTEAEKDKWDEYIDDDETEYRHLSELIRHAVSKEIEGTHGVGEAATTDRGDVADVLTAVQDLRRRFEGVETRVETAAEAMRAEGGVSDATIVSVMQSLPDNITHGKTPQEIADETELPVKDVEVALVEAKRETGLVRALPLDDEGSEFKYWKEGGS